MEELQKKFEDLSEKFEEQESEICAAICSLERATFLGVDQGKKQLEIAEKRLKYMDDLIFEAMSLHPLSEEVNSRFTQVLVSYQPRLESFVDRLKQLLDNPPTESLYPPITDAEIFPEQSHETNQNVSKEIDENQENEKNEDVVNA